MTRALLVSLLVGACAAAPAAQGRPRTVAQASARFLALWSAYRRGDADAAVDAFSKWKAKDVAAEAVLPAPVAADPWSQAALVALHTEAAIRNNTFARFAEGTPNQLFLGGWGLEDVYEVHAYQAFLLVRDLTRIGKRTGDERLLTFVRNWYIVAISYCLRWRLTNALTDLWGIADHDFGENPEMRLLLGSVAESRAAPIPYWTNVACWYPNYLQGAHGCILFAPTGGDGPAAGQEALYEFRHALDDDPALLEARVRLGRLLHLIGRNDESRDALTRALTDARAARQPFCTYLAALFLGELDEEVAHDLPAAVAHYRAAVEAYPFAHYGHLALGQALVRSGDDDGWMEARGMFDGESADHPAALDPYGVYYYAQYWQLASRLRAMRGAVRP